MEYRVVDNVKEELKLKRLDFGREATSIDVVSPSSAFTYVRYDKLSAERLSLLEHLV